MMALPPLRAVSTKPKTTRLRPFCLEAAIIADCSKATPCGHSGSDPCRSAGSPTPLPVSRHSYDLRLDQMFSAIPQRMPFLLPDTDPPGIKRRVKWAALGLYAIVCAVILSWYTVRVGDPSWKSAISRLSYMNNWQPIWRQLSCALSAALLFVCGLIGFWKAARPFRSSEGVDDRARKDR